MFTNLIRNLQRLGVGSQVVGLPCQSIFKVLSKTKLWAIIEYRTMHSGEIKGDQTVRLRHVRYKEKCDGNLPVPSLIELCVVGTGGGGTPKSLIVNMNNFKYLFNCGEGTQRIAAEHKMKLSRVEQIFITHSSWDNIGGLMGLCLTVETAGVESITLHGPLCAETHVTSARSFAQLRSLKLRKREITEGDFVDTAMRVQYVPIYPTAGSICPSTAKPLSDSDNEESEEQNGDRDSKRIKLSDEAANAAQASNVDLVNTAEDLNASIIYICTPHSKPRSVSLEKCVEQRVPAGPLMGKLKDGESVMLKCGRVVNPDDILEPAEPNNPFIVVECPRESYVDGLVNNCHLSKHQSQPSDFNSSSPDLSACIVVHFTPPEVLESEKYQAWMTLFGDKTEHLIINESCSDLSTEAVYRIQAKLNLLHPSIYPLLPKQLEATTSVDSSSTQKRNSLSSVSRHITYGETNLSYILRARVARLYNREQCLLLVNSLYTKEALDQLDFSEALEQLKKAADPIQSSAPGCGDYPEILFLGTGSTMPNKVRNVSAIWLNLTPNDSLLLDCGENTYGQLYRHYGDKTRDMLSRLRAVYISHLHADHHLGVVGLAMERHQQFQSGSLPFEPLVILAPGMIRGWYKSLHSDIVPITDLVKVIPLEHLYVQARKKYSHVYEHVLSHLNLSQIQAVWAHHRQWPHALVLDHRDGWKLSYSGDTTPCKDFIKAGINSDVLIHEATMEDDLVDEARDRKHSTTSQAIDVGVQMNAKAIILTHFSQRYAKVPIFTNTFSANVGIAFDNMKVRLSDLPLLSKFTPALKTMFADDYSDMERKSEKKRIRKSKKT